MRICVLGTGYVGLVAGTCFAENGNSVVCVDVNKEKIERLNQGELPIYEPGLNDLVIRNHKEKRLSFTTDSPRAIQDAEVIFIAVGTPASTDGSADLALFMKAAETIAENMKNYKIIVNKSTVPVGTAAKVEKLIRSKTDQAFDVVSNPEFLKEGTAIDDFLKPDRVVIGTSKESVYKVMAELYAPFVRQGNPILWMSNVSAEMTKYAANCFLATKISFINEVANLCEAVGADIESVRKGITSDIRIGKHFLYAGVGYGGSCFPKDVKALIKTAQDAGQELKVVQSAEEVNEKQKKLLFQKIQKQFEKQLSEKVFAVWGLSFKPNTDDMREAPSLVIIESLLRAGARIQVFDPVALKEAKKHFPKEAAIQYCAEPYEALSKADALVLVTEWNEFRNPDFQKMKSLMRSPVVFDGRNVYSPDSMKNMGFTYHSVGRA
ncbi:MAG: UDP-glucose/GDP-mannose dehydrogenase family protein [Bacteriovoracia bacterium]